MFSAPSPALPRSLSLSRPSKNDQDVPWIPTPRILSQYPFLQHLRFCNSVKHLDQIHAQCITSGAIHNNFVASRIVSFAALSPNGSIPYARRLFDQIPKPDTFMANTLIRAYASGPYPVDAILFYICILETSLRSPDAHTIPLLLKACSSIHSLSLGRAIHSHALKFGWGSQIPVLNYLVYMYSSCGLIDSAELVFWRMTEFDDASGNIMIDGYLKCGFLDAARRLFDEISDKNVVTWSVMINGYVQRSFFKEALELFRKMQVAKVEPNESVLVNVLSACAHLGAMEQGKWIEGYVRKKNASITARLGTALVDMYSKCGCVERALQVFNEMKEKNVLTWSAVIGGLAINGHGKDALHLFSRMERHGVAPNDVTFIGILNACSHSGLVNEGSRYFDVMTEVYGIKPNIQHYCCMVDLYGRAGLLDQAEKIIEGMPMQPNSAVWGSLLNACRIHRNVQLGERIGKQLLELEPEHSGRYVLLSNIYAAQGRWDHVADLRRVMKERGVAKMPGCSFIDMRGTIHEFVAGDNLHPESELIYAKLEEISNELKLAGYVPNTSAVLLDMHEEEKETALCHHSEKLAIAFGLINSKPGATIRITKNLRVCGDCHAATKMISKIYEHEIIVRDRTRFSPFQGRVMFVQGLLVIFRGSAAPAGLNFRKGHRPIVTEIYAHS